MIQIPIREDRETQNILLFDKLWRDGWHFGFGKMIDHNQFPEDELTTRLIVYKSVSFSSIPQLKRRYKSQTPRIYIVTLVQNHEFKKPRLVMKLTNVTVLI